MRTLLVAVLATLLAGCAGGTSARELEGDGAGDVADVAATATTGGIHGFVVDEKIHPVIGATVTVTPGEASATTNADGAFVINGLDPGVYFVKAEHPLYDSAQQTVEVVAGEADPEDIKLLLNRVIFATPYAQIQKFDGFLVCSIGFFLYASEECGQGVGVPCEVPVLGCSRVGGQGNNHAQWDFYLDGPFVQTLVIEMTWEPTSSTLSEFQLNVGNDWTCDPTCNGNPLNVTGGPSPLYATVDFPRELEDKDGNAMEFTQDTRFSTFIWPNWGCANFGVPSTPECAGQLNVAVNQPFTQFATAFYYLPAPDGWSFVAGDELPS
ncbi:MAG TPA: carboxypeptidase-like regulatory domain-containing protein [Candidatus Thermoplasmatota archaeon]|nr:carboxypeptidase-like regulatory domain-containing protein [Candidatus Thermoplasmatota archaeon]